MLCSKCGGEVKIISFIHELTVIKKILVHLKLYSEPVQQRAPLAPSRDLSERVKHVSYDDGRSGYEEPVVDVKLL